MQILSNGKNFCLSFETTWEIIKIEVTYEKYKKGVTTILVSVRQI